MQDMNHDHQATAVLARTAPAQFNGPANGEFAPSEEMRFDPWAVVRRSLRGRYGWVAIMSAVAALIGGLIGYKVEKPQYKSEGLIRIAYTLPPVFRETDQNAPLAMFDSYMRSQVMRMMSRSLIETALMQLNDGKAVSPETLADVADNLSVEHPYGDEHLRPTYTDDDPYQAAQVVQAVVTAYRASYEEQDRKVEDSRLEVLNAHRGDLQSKLDDIESQASKLFLNGAAERHKLDAQHMLVSDQLDADEQVLHQYYVERSQLEEQLRQFAQNGYLDGHPKVQEAKFSLDRINHIISQLQPEIQQLRGMAPGQMAPTPSAAAMGTTPTASPDAPAPGADVSMASAMTALDIVKMKLDRYESDAAAIRKELAETTQRIEALKLESAESRLEIISACDVPLQPFRDRRKLFAYLGATLGGLAPMLALVLASVVRPRFRYSDETEVQVAGPAGLLGILPSLPNQMIDVETSAGAAQCVHQMRVMLQVASRGQSRQYLLTSAVSGEGKTSLTMALALSFAASGSRTLVVDCDMVGRALTRGLNASDQEGLFECLGQGDARRNIRQTHSGIWFLPAGRVNALYASKVSHRTIRKFLDEMRKDYDVVLVDSGPVLGSIEASTVASEVDGVIITVTRGQESSLVEKTTQHLRAVGANIEGYVFNRAKSRDFHHSAYGTSARPMSSRDVLARRVSEDADGMLHFGPLVEAVMSSLPEQEPESPHLFMRLEEIESK